MTGERLGVYVHVPFCKKKCPYCHFYVIKDRPHDAFVATLLQEWQQLDSSQLVDTLYFGGGTPSLLDPEHFENLIKAIKPKGEVTLEVNPESITLEKLKGFKSAGINRLSIGVQSFDNDLLKAIGREHTAEESLQAIDWATNAGFSNITIDLMYDLPEQTLSSWQKTLDQAITLPITHISLYNLQIEPNTYFHKFPPKQPSEAVSEVMLKTAYQRLPEAGFSRYEISAFAKLGCQAEHNTSYWKAKPFIGLGPSAFSYMNGERYQNTPHFGKYCQKVQSRESPIEFREKLDPKAATLERLAIHLRLKEGVDLRPFDINEAARKKIEDLCELELLLKEGENLALSEKGTLVYDAIASELVLVS